MSDTMIIEIINIHHDHHVGTRRLRKGKAATHNMKHVSFYILRQQTGVRPYVLCIFSAIVLTAAPPIRLTSTTWKQ